MTKRLFAVEPATLRELLASRAQTHPDRLAFAEGDAELSYRALFDDASAIAAGLVASGALSGTSGERVALSIPAGLAFVRLFWALQLLGVTTCALNPYTPAASVLKRAMRIRPRLLVTHDEEVARLAEVPALLLQDLPRSRDPLPRNDIDPEDIAILQTTSGTSGEPRAAMIRHRNVLLSVAGAVESLGYGPDDVLVSWVPPWHDLGLIRFMIGSVYFGAPCHIVQPAIATIPDWLRTISRVGGTITGAPDFAYRLATRLVDPKSVNLRSLKYATNGGEPVRLTTIEAFEQTFDVPGVILPGYGLAEATLGVTCRVAGEALRVDARGNVSCGRLLPHLELRIAGDGEIVLRGPVVFAGYFEQENVLQDGWLHTGDVGHLDEDGHLYVLGRKRAMLKRGGAVLAPRELEEIAQRVHGVRIAMAVGVTSKFATEEIVVAVEADAEEERVKREIVEAIQRELGFAPERVLTFARNTLPRTYNGKLRHDALRQQLESAP
ncbi:MAG TPA: AMP-binding protein [Thermoanaerobaculia bacterium]|nr:AMP-binding protein [Thermoanaerobaculia bacterium]